MAIGPPPAAIVPRTPLVMKLWSMTLREPIGTAVVDWTAAITLGKLRDFYASLVRTVYFNGNASAATRLLNVMFGSGYMGDSNSVTLTRGSKAGRYGALAGFQFAAPPAAAAMALRKWETLANKGLGNEGQQSVLYCQQVFELVNSVPSKYGHEESYGLKLSDAFVSDACVSKLVAGVHLAATNASQDGDPNKSAKVVAMSQGARHQVQRLPLRRGARRRGDSEGERCRARRHETQAPEDGSGGGSATHPAQRHV